MDNSKQYFPRILFNTQHILVISSIVIKYSRIQKQYISKELN